MLFVLLFLVCSQSDPLFLISSHFLFLSVHPYFCSLMQGKKNSVFRECYFGSQRHCKLTRLYPACSYTFRVAAHNDIGTRYIHCTFQANAFTLAFYNAHNRTVNSSEGGHMTLLYCSLLFKKLKKSLFLHFLFTLLTWQCGWSFYFISLTVSGSVDDYHHLLYVERHFLSQSIWLMSKCKWPQCLTMQ